MKLIYRAQVLNYQPKPLCNYQQPYALNWRYQVSEKSNDESTRIPSYRQPRALNWRYCPSV